MGKLKTVRKILSCMEVFASLGRSRSGVPFKGGSVMKRQLIFVGGIISLAFSNIYGVKILLKKGGPRITARREAREGSCDLRLIAKCR